MSSFDLRLPLGTEEIKKLIPHRYPFLLVDRIIEYVPGESIVGIKNVSIGEPYLDGHFPGNPVMPGVLQVEALAQASAVFGRLTEPTVEGCLLAEISEARFRRLVVPGDTLRLDIKVEKRRKNFFWFIAEALVEGQVAASVKFSAKLG